jgi:hypothetical protein
MHRQIPGILLAASLIVALPSMTAHATEALITQEEAALPPPKGAIAADRRGVTRGPKIELVSGEQIVSPTHFQLKFLSYGGATIDPGSLKMTYLRTPNVDLTARVKAYVQPTGLDMPDVSLPPGEHMLRVDVKDSDGRAGSTSFVLKVTR